METKNNLRKNRILAVSVLLIFTIFLVNIVIQKSRLKKNHRYTICYVYDVTSTSSATLRVWIYYYINNEKYIVNNSLDDFGSEIIGNRYFLKFNPDDHSNNKILFYNGVVHGSIIVPPDSGWAYIPKAK
jgi:hypothetical protein